MTPALLLYVRHAGAQRRCVPLGLPQHRFSGRHPVSIVGCNNEPPPAMMKPSMAEIDYISMAVDTVQRRQCQIEGGASASQPQPTFLTSRHAATLQTASVRCRSHLEVEVGRLPGGDAVGGLVVVGAPVLVVVLLVLLLPIFRLRPELQGSNSTPDTSGRHSSVCEGRQQVCAAATYDPDLPVSSAPDPALLARLMMPCSTVTTRHCTAPLHLCQTRRCHSLPQPKVRVFARSLGTGCRWV